MDRPDNAPPTPPSLPQRLRSRGARVAFLLRLIWRVAGRGLAQVHRRRAPPAPVEKAEALAYDQIIEALQTGDTAFLDRLGAGFASATDPDSGQPWLFAAVDLGSLASLRWFLAQGVALDGADKEGRSLLQAAAERAAAVDEYDEAPENALPLIAALLAAGAAINAPSRQGLTALHVAAALGLLEVVQLLLAHGADRGLRDEGFAAATPLDYAVQAGHQAVADLLR